MTTIIGAGLAGLIAANLIHDDSLVIYDENESVPNNHSAVMRFRSSIVGDSLDIPFTKVKMMKASLPWSNPIADNLAYAYKCTGLYTIRSLISADATLQDRWIAPEDLVSQLYIRAKRKIVLGQKITDFSFPAPVISTVPMPSLMKILKYPVDCEFKSVHGFNINARLHKVDAYVSLYVSNPHYLFNRISITGNRLTIEYSGFNVENKNDDFIEKQTRDAIELLGIYHPDIIKEQPTIKKQSYSKILPIDEDVRKRFIMWATDKHQIYSLGRYATWRPSLLLDDLIQDIRVIKGLIAGKSSYQYRK